MKIYIAGPLFTRAEQIFNHTLFIALYDALCIEYEDPEVYLPQNFSEDYIKSNNFDGLFMELVRNIDDADLLIAILDGADSDSGTCWEVGYTYAKKKPIIGLRTDFRQQGDSGGLNLMLDKCLMWYLLETQKINIKQLSAKLVKMITETI